MTPACPKCDGRMRIYTPWDEPPENHFEECYEYGHKNFYFDEEEA